MAEETKNDQEIIDLTEEPDALVQRVFNDPLGDALPVSWQHQLRVSSESNAQPVEFVLSILSRCVAEEPPLPHFVALSFVEITLWFVHSLKVQFPVEQSTTGQWMFKHPAEMLLRPTIAALALKVKQGFRSGLRQLGLERYLCVGLNRQVAGIVIPIDGALLSIPAETHFEICHLTNSFFPRLLRKEADAAKPC